MTRSLTRGEFFWMGVVGAGAGILGSVEVLVPVIVGFSLMVYGFTRKERTKEVKFIDLSEEKS